MQPMGEKATFLAPIGSGIGDVIVALPVLEALAGRGDGPVYLVARGPRQLGFDAAIPELAGVVREIDLQTSLSNAGDSARYINLRDHKLQTHYDWYSEAFARDYPNYTINDIMRDVCRSFDLEVNFNCFPKLVSQVVPEVGGKIAIVPGATSDFKAVPAGVWMNIVQGLRERGHEVIMLGEAERSPVVAELLSPEIAHQPTPSIQDAINVLSSVKGVISVDTGLMHIAVQQGTPTVAIFNRVHTYYRAAPNCQAIIGPPCAPECKAQVAFEFPFPVDYKEWIWWNGKYEFCNQDKSCMSYITASGVLHAFDDLPTRSPA